MKQCDFMIKANLKDKHEIILTVHWRHDIHADNAYLMKIYSFSCAEQFHFHINMLIRERTP